MQVSTTCGSGLVLIMSMTTYDDACLLAITCCNVTPVKISPCLAAAFAVLKRACLLIVGEATFVRLRQEAGQGEARAKSQRVLLFVLYIDCKKFINIQCTKGTGWIFFLTVAAADVVRGK